MDFKIIDSKIKEYNRIIILRHNNPDLDALGSQLGFMHVLKNRFPEKEIYVTGDMNKFDFIGGMDDISDEMFEGSLVFIFDVCVAKMICDPRYYLAKEIIIVDHHNNPVDLCLDGKECTVPYIDFIDNKRVACAEFVPDICMELGYEITKEAATCFFAGIITDSGRFQYATSSSTFRVAAHLMDCGATPTYIYNKLYVESIESRKMKSYFANSFKLTKNNVAYLINDKTIYDKFDIDPFSLSRGMVAQMAGLEGVYIWANFTYDYRNDNVMCEFRSREITIVDIAKKYGGGGHNMACGATLPNFDQVNDILNDFDKLLEENGYV